MEHLEEAYDWLDNALDHTVNSQEPEAALSLAFAQLEATLALVQEQRTANLIAAYNARLGTITDRLEWVIKNRMGLRL